MKMLIADSGSTKTTWCVIDLQEGVREYHQTPGINPYYQGKTSIISMLEGEFRGHDIQPGSLFFYGAGCTTPSVNEVIYQASGSFFKAPHIEVQSDMMGAARSLCGREAGIACIMGTGSNSCYYDGVSIVENVSPLGFILGDEGSGGALGKRLLSDILKKQLPERLIRLFFESGITRDEIMENIYRKPFPNRYAAQFTRFLYNNRNEPALKRLITGEFIAFFRRNVMQYGMVYETGIHFTGSIAWYFKDFLEEAASSLSLRIGKVVQEPMEGLIGFHLQNQEGKPV